MIVLVWLILKGKNKLIKINNNKISNDNKVNLN